MDADAIRAIVTALQTNGVQTLGLKGLAESIPVAAVPRGNGTVEVVSMKKFIDEYATRPDRAKGTAKVETLDSFISLTLRHRLLNSVIFAQISGGSPSLTTVVDYHNASDDEEVTPEFCQHRIVYAFPLSHEWKAWSGQSGKTLTQGDFAQWIFDHVADLAAPTPDEAAEFGALYQTTVGTPADIITLSRGLQISVSSNIKDIRVLQSGEAQIAYEEEHRDAGGQRLIVPGLMMLRIPLFQRGEPTRIPVHLRYRRAAQSVAWTFSLVRPEAVLEAAVLEAAIDASNKTTLPFYAGTPES